MIRDHETTRANEPACAGLLSTLSLHSQAATTTVNIVLRAPYRAVRVRFPDLREFAVSTPVLMLTLNTSPWTVSVSTTRLSLAR
jgi:hypothetical protein